MAFNLSILTESIRENTLLPSITIVILTLIQLGTQFTGIDYLSYGLTLLMLIIYGHTGYTIIKNGHNFSNVIATAIVIGIIQSIVYALITILATFSGSKLFLSVAFLGLPYQISKSFSVDPQLVVAVLLGVSTVFSIAASTISCLVGGVIGRRL
ncbi:hypothetical protein COT30_03200 [Candidatus Micrarchaeota archaeon CG08_land_8_20_14_0_20_49_17]|nr:MAG: hypothetical protein AUJ13_05860 [Candidatus Micrarchaeota archaeon CG1_02_49_24]PIU09661.1 MAG: hypothetical protein COT30_03200 [Candidatus Micrarchaeota archaeon CG08_land_8_20_14_0_20_49_17]PIZ97604.1 MAG: hypothetical protein COX84_03005 [Candidatus Micrarchaeota archaeon CG_4_10_14_0_2_um_filter_49_7]HII54365.1 hypothetical protein [Candidatus Micrarchaeota archaeon]